MKLERHENAARLLAMALAEMASIGDPEVDEASEPVYKAIAVVRKSAERKLDNVSCKHEMDVIY